jgi:hypothetical protein
VIDLVPLVDAIAANPAALERLHQLVGSSAHLQTPTHVAYTPATLAAELGRTERSIRDAINRGELAAVKRGRGWVIGADAVAGWARPAPPVGSPRRRSARSAGGQVARDALRGLR